MFVITLEEWYNTNKNRSGDVNMTKISKRQTEIYNFIVSTVTDQGYPPTVREIGEAIGLKSSSTVHAHLNKLEANGLIKRDPSKPRALVIVERESNIDKANAKAESSDNVVNFPKQESSHPTTVSVPLLGKVAAGNPIAAIEHPEDYFPLPETIVYGQKNVFMLEISGDSMIEAGIHNGDYVIVSQQETARNGEIVIAMTDEYEATCKRFYKENGYFRLQPENASLEPIILDRVQIVGKVVGLYRNVIQ